MNAKEKIEELLEASEDGTITAAQVTEAGLHRSVLQEFVKSGEMYRFDKGEIHESLIHAKKLCARLQTMTNNDDGYRSVIEELIPGIPESSTVCPPFHCDHGNGIIIGSNVFINYNCVMLDGAYIRIGDNVKIGPACQIYTPHHPIDHIERRESQESAFPVTIGEDTWLGGGCIICPGVTIGRRCIIGAGSVVVHDIPDDSLAAGNPAVVKRRLV